MLILIKAGYKFMVLNLPFVKLPKDLTSFLMSNSRHAESQELRLSTVIQNNPALRIRIEETLGEEWKGVNLNNALKSYGWKFFRDRIISFYLTKRYDENLSDPSRIIQPILEFEDLFYDYSLLTNLRLCLLGLYLKIVELELELNDLDETYQVLDMVSETRPLIRMRNAKNKRCDWLILVTWHLLQYYGQGKLIELLEEDANYSKLYSGIEDQNFKASMIRNLTNYGASIDDTYVMLNEFAAPINS